MDQIKQTCFSRYNDKGTSVRLNDREAFKHIQKEVTPHFFLFEEWEKAILHDIRAHALPLHPSLIQSTRENMELIIMHSFYHDTTDARFNELVKSVDVVFDMVLRAYQHD